MGFKKPGAKKKKKKQKSGADREWAFEGGQTMEETGVERNQPVMEGGRMRRQTQDRDERLRRGRMKIEMRKERDNFRSRMSKKVKFDENVGGKPNVSRPVKKVRKEPPVSSNPMPIFERLQAMIASSRGEAYEVRSGSDSDASEDESASQSYDEGSDTPDNADDKQEEAQEESDDDEGEVNLVGYYDWFFSSPADSGVDVLPASQKSVPLGTLYRTEGSETTLSGWLHPSVQPPRIRRVGDIPGLHKLWVERGEVSLGKREGRLLSYLSCYADIFVEVPSKKDGATACYDAELTASLRHVVTHVMRAR